MRGSGVHRSEQPRYAAIRDGGTGVPVPYGGYRPSEPTSEHQNHTDYLAGVAGGGKSGEGELAACDLRVRRRTAKDTAAAATVSGGGDPAVVCRVGRWR
jgi:hypothetical protein